MARSIIIGSRGSDLALWQARFVQQQLRERGYEAEIEIIKTQGDKIQHLSLEKLEGKGFFTKEIEEALLSQKVDIAVHSHKDLPTAKTPGLIIAAVSDREDPSELLLIRKSSVDTTQPWHLAKGVTVGTSSARRYVQLHQVRPDIQFNDLRGNVPTRIQKLRDGQYDAILLAFAGVHRLQLNLDDLHVVKLSPEQFIPAPAQGVLAYQCREDDDEMIALLSTMRSDYVADTITVERTVMQLFNGGCHMPLGVYCKRVNGMYHAWAAQAVDRQGNVRRMYMRGEDNHQLAQQLFKKLQISDGRSVLITAEPDQSAAAIAILQSHGCKVTAQSFLEIKPTPFTVHDQYDWLFFTSKNGVRFFFEQEKQIPPHIKIGAIGQETAQQIEMAGFPVHFMGNGDVTDTSRQFSTVATGKRVVFAGAQNARAEIRNAVKQYAMVEEWIVYSNNPHPQTAPVADIIAFTSPMQVDGYLEANHLSANHVIVAIGETTAQHVREKTGHNVHVPPHASFISMAEYICGML